MNRLEEHSRSDGQSDRPSQSSLHLELKKHKLLIPLRDEKSVIFQITLVSIPNSIKGIEWDGLLH